MGSIVCRAAVLDSVVAVAVVPLIARLSGTHFGLVYDELDCLVQANRSKAGRRAYDETGPAASPSETRTTSSGA